MPYFLLTVLEVMQTALHRIFDAATSKIRVLNNKMLLIFELLNFADFSMDLCVFSKLFQLRGSRFNRLPGVGPYLARFNIFLSAPPPSWKICWQHFLCQNMSQLYIECYRGLPVPRHWFESDTETSFWNIPDFCSLFRGFSKHMKKSISTVWRCRRF